MALTLRDASKGCCFHFYEELTVRHEHSHMRDGKISDIVRQIYTPYSHHVACTHHIPVNMINKIKYIEINCKEVEIGSIYIFFYSSGFFADHSGSVTINIDFCSKWLWFFWKPSAEQLDELQSWRQFIHAQFLIRKCLTTQFWCTVKKCFVVLWPNISSWSSSLRHKQHWDTKLRRRRGIFVRCLLFYFYFFNRNQL